MGVYLGVLITCPIDKADELAMMIVEERLGACVNIVEKVRSIYRWEGRIVKDEESLLVVKTSAERFDELLKKVKEVHPYTVPEIIAFSLVGGNNDYLKWIDECVARQSSA
ncbi:MAG: divalent-cation tolerance protein CutA [Aquificaceae bacterium]|nr:divalent-cation tolerance protein CutA [Aquificaceae bacterium]MDW8236794.1 divalent-cation tolerance protein CutA [Aquificaceae bacterium]